MVEKRWPKNGPRWDAEVVMTRRRVGHERRRHDEEAPPDNQKSPRPDVDRAAGRWRRELDQVRLAADGVGR